MRTSRERSCDVAIYAPFAGPLYELDPGPVGGAEIQSAYLARALAARGFRVRHIVAGANIVSSRDGVDVQALSANYATRGFRRRQAVVRALREANAALYIQRSAGFETGVVGLYARSTGRRFVFSSSSEGDFLRDVIAARNLGACLDEWPTRVQYLVGLRLAHAIVVQTEDQLELASRERGVDATVIRSFCAPAEIELRPREAFLWVGAIVGVKDPLAYVELAERVPEASFWMIATERSEVWSELARELRARAESTPNLRLLPRISREKLLGLYARSVAIVSTSEFEGFPNTFLEAWARGTPALSLRVDPDGAIESCGLGITCNGSFSELAAAAKRLWEQREEIDAERPREYVKRVHDPAVVGAQWAALVRELLEH